MSDIQEFDFSVDLLQNILWQYNEATALQSLITQKQEWYIRNHTEFWSDWMVDVFDLNTANDFGLAVWAIILNIPLVVAADPQPGKIAWGFGPERRRFNRGNFAPSASGFGLTTAEKRLVLKLRYFQLVTRGAAPEVNAFLNYVFGPGVVYMADGLEMKIRYVFSSAIPAQLQLVFNAFDLLPRPAGVGSGTVVVDPGAAWGFGPNRNNFNNGNFHHGP